MCGTGRVSIPLLDSGRKMTCIDYSEGMLDSFKQKIRNKNYPVNIFRMDVTNLSLDSKFGLIILPFHSFSEIISTESQIKALKTISHHLDKNGIFILTLQNPKTRLRSADGVPRVIGKFPMDNNRHMIISYVNEFDSSDSLVSGFQFYEIYDSTNNLTGKRFLETNFKLITDSQLKNLLGDTGLEIAEMFGDYSYSSFDEENSNFMIYKMVKK